MQSSLIAIVLCCVVQTAAAQCVPTTQATGTPATPAPELIKTSVALTQSRAVVDEESSRPAGPGMLFAAVALMCGIALRRYRSGKQ